MRQITPSRLTTNLDFFLTDNTYLYPKQNAIFNLSLDFQIIPTKKKNQITPITITALNHYPSVRKKQPVMLLLLFVLPTLLFFTSIVQTANILGVALHPSFSHQIVFRPIWKQLSLRGHNVTVLTTDPINDANLKNLTEIDLSFAYKIWKSSSIIEVSRKEGYSKFFFKSIDVGEEIMRAQLEVKEVQELLKNPNNKTFDLIIVEPVYSLGLGFAAKFNCPLVLVFSLDAFGNLQRIFGNPNHYILYPTHVLPIDNPMGFFERLRVFLYPFFEKYALSHVYSKNNILLKKYFETNTTIEQLFNKASLLLTNVNPAFGVIRPTVPTVIPLGGGFHLEPPKPLLDNELKTFLNNASDGVIYFSLGSNVFSANIEQDRRRLLLETFSELPYKIIWKFENETMPGKPDNVYLFKWLPQWDVLSKKCFVNVFLLFGFE